MLQNKLIQVIIIILLFWNIVYSQFQNIRISNTHSPEETTIMINPKNPDQIVAGSNAYYWNTDSSLSAYYFSTNGGLNWSQGPIVSRIAKPCGDPCVVVDTNENFYLTSIVTDAVGLITNKSTNHGANWTQGVNYGMNGEKFEDKPWTCVDLTHSQYGNYFYATWTEFDVYNSRNSLDSSRIMFSRSRDGGETFSVPNRISRYGGDCRDSSETVEGAVPCTGPNGEVYVSWAGPRGICFNKSIDGGVSWLATEITTVPSYPRGWCFNIVGLNRCNGFPITGCDISNGPYRGTIYINWSDQRNGIIDTDIWLIKSTDGGITWSAIKRVNNDPPGKQQFFTWMSIDQVTGYLYFVFYDERNYSGFYADIYAARSTDGGETFTNIKVNSSPIYLNGGFLGDYICISAYNNKIRPIWSRLASGINEIWTANIDTFSSIGIRSIGISVTEEFRLKQNYPNPFNPNTNIEFDLPKNTLAKLIIYDLTGKEIEILVNNELQAGKHNVQWDGSNFSSGIYFYKLQTESFSDTKKLVLIK